MPNEAPRSVVMNPSDPMKNMPSLHDAEEPVQGQPPEPAPQAEPDPAGQQAATQLATEPKDPMDPWNTQLAEYDPALIDPQHAAPTPEIEPAAPAAPVIPPPTPAAADDIASAVAQYMEGRVSQVPDQLQQLQNENAAMRADLAKVKQTGAVQTAQSAVEASQGKIAKMREVRAAAMEDGETRVQSQMTNEIEDEQLRLMELRAEAKTQAAAPAEPAPAAEPTRTPEESAREAAYHMFKFSTEMTPEEEKAWQVDVLARWKDPEQAKLGMGNLWKASLKSIRGRGQQNQSRPTPRASMVEPGHGGAPQGTSAPTEQGLTRSQRMAADVMGMTPAQYRAMKG